MRIAIEKDEFGRMICKLADGGKEATVTASNAAEAAEGLTRAVERAAAEGSGECFWQEATGEYRWMFRREGDQVRIAVMWSTGTMTGWEHVFWKECELEAVARQVQEELARVSGG